MYIKSPYPDVPPFPATNCHDIFFNRPDQAEWPDYTVHIDPATGFRRTRREFIERIRDGATALGAPVSAGGLGLRGGDQWRDGWHYERECNGRSTEYDLLCTDLWVKDYATLVQSLLVITTPFALISSYSTPFELKHALDLSKPTRLFVAAEEVGISPQKVYILGGHVRGRRSFSEMIDDARDKQIPREPVRPVGKDTLAYLVFSSGTSGLPKAVMISHHNVNYSLAQRAIVNQTNAEVYTAPTPPTPEGIPVVLGFLPMHHSYGLHAYIFQNCLAPSTVVIISRWNTEVALKAVSKFRVTHLSLIPSIVHQLVNYPRIHEADFSSVMTMTCGAAYLPAELNVKMSALVPKDTVFLEGTLGGLTRIPGCTGVLLPGMEARIIRDDDSEAGLNEVGELYLKGENVALGYWNNESASRETFVNGWLRTGDKFRFNENGYFYYADRSKDTLKVSGSQVSPVEIENVLLAHPGRLVIDATVAGVSGGRTSDERVPRAWVVLSEEGKKAGASAVIRELEAWHQENLSKYKWLRGGIEIVEEIPKSPTGKTLRRVLQDHYEQQFAKVKGKL
ncbi:hypothetical protein BD779DRAFT_1786298 [Infundibulicybe gibba]|nr:hypothetical protein BD779DRAFT_1786298 [Infundibulicybe gibba]